jgi:hypothetical protein
MWHVRAAPSLTHAIAVAITDTARVGQYERQRQRSGQHLEREQRASERHAVDGGQAGPGVRRDEQTPLPDR